MVKLVEVIPVVTSMRASSKLNSTPSGAEITIETSNGRIGITISDNGRGMETPENMSDLPASGKLGLAGMQERAQLLGATLTIESETGQGTRICIKADT